MAKPRVFVSSTYVDLIDVRSLLKKLFDDLCFEAKLFERGGVYYNPSKTIMESCKAEISESDLFCSCDRRQIW